MRGSARSITPDAWQHTMGRRRRQKRILSTKSGITLSAWSSGPSTDNRYASQVTECHTTMPLAGGDKGRLPVPFVTSPRAQRLHQWHRGCGTISYRVFAVNNGIDGNRWVPDGSHSW